MAEEAHKGQTRRDGRPYVTHCHAVVLRVEGDSQAEQVAWLHDVIEDTSVTEQEMRDMDVDPDVVDAVVLLTKPKGGDYMEYLRRVKTSELATKVKIADMLANLTDAPTEEQINRYVAGLAFLRDIPPLASTFTCYAAMGNDGSFEVAKDRDTLQERWDDEYGDAQPDEIREVHILRAVPPAVVVKLSATDTKAAP